MNKRLFFHLLTAVVLVALSFSVFGSEAWAGEVSFGYQTSVVHALAMVADHADLFEEVGLEVQTQVFTSGPLVSEAIGAGALDLGMMGDTPTVIAAASPLPVEIIASAGGGGSRQRLMVGRESEIEEIADLEGKRLGLRMGTSAHGGFFRLAEIHGLDPQSVQIIDLNPPEMPDALATGQIDAVLIWEPTPTLIEASNSGQELTTLEQTGNTFPVFVLANENFTKNNQQKVVALLRALHMATTFIEENPEETAEIVSEVTGLDPNLARKSMDLHYYTVEFGEETLQSLTDTASFLVGEGLIAAAPDFKEDASREFIDQIEE